MIINESINEMPGMSQEKAFEEGYRKEDGSLTMYYLNKITPVCEQRAKEFEIALKQFHYNFPLDGEYRISWKIEKIS